MYFIICSVFVRDENNHLFLVSNLNFLPVLQDMFLSLLLIVPRVTIFFFLTIKCHLAEHVQRTSRR